MRWQWSADDRDLEPGQRLYYNVGSPEELQGALDSITSEIALCLFTASPEVVSGPLEVLVDNEIVAYDPERRDGWDWTEPGRGELTLFGAACSRAIEPEAVITARSPCPGGEE